MNQALGGSCTVPVGAWCLRVEQGLHLRGMVGDPVSGRLLHAQAEGAVDDAVQLGQQVATALLAQGAGDWL
jgi:hydroxymethylbilane synthase